MSPRREKCFELIADEVWLARPPLEAAQELMDAWMISIVENEVFHHRTDHTVGDTSGERANVCMAHRNSVAHLPERFEENHKSSMDVKYKRSTGAEMRKCRAACSRMGTLDAGPGERDCAEGSP